MSYGKLVKILCHLGLLDSVVFVDENHDPSSKAKEYADIDLINP